MKIQLKEWSYGTRCSDPYTAPELISTCLSGKVYGHPDPRHCDGKEIVTSRVIGKRNQLVITRSGNEYELLNPAFEYEKNFPNSKERLLNALIEM